MCIYIYIYMYIRYIIKEIGRKLAVQEAPEPPESCIRSVRTVSQTKNLRVEVREKIPKDLGAPLLRIKNPTESDPLKSRFLDV